MAHILGWVDDDALGVCGGAFKNEAILAEYQKKYLKKHSVLPVVVPGKKPLIQYGADNGVGQINEGTSKWTGNVFISQPDQKLTGHQATISYSRDLKKWKQVDFTGGVHFIEPDQLAVADHGSMNLLENTGHLYQVIYRFPNEALSTPSNATRAPSAWGSATEFEQTAKGIQNLKDATYTTCPWKSHAWHLKAKKININHRSQEVTVSDATLYIKQVPVFYFPYYRFPLDRRRESGFLPPQVSTSTDDGFGLLLPYYWNMAPNYDVIFTPGSYSQRGPVLNTLFRYLTASNSGQVRTSYFFHDNAFASFQKTAPSQYTIATPEQKADLENASTHRSAISWVDKTALGHKWTAASNMSWVSDDYFMEDLPFKANFNPYNLPNQVLQEAQANYFDKHWNFTGLVQHYQTLHPIDLAPTQNQYARLPELDWNGEYLDQRWGLDYTMSNQYVNFVRNRDPWETTAPLMGSRFHIEPAISLPLSSPQGYVTPRLSMDLTKYYLHNTTAGSLEMSRAVPIASVDSGLYFKRGVSFLGRTYVQTLEPRLFYLYVPYRNQSALPLFDSFSQVLNYDQLFLDNRFTGLDRVGDANQVTLGLKTRFLDQKDGFEKFSAGIAAIGYFQDRQVLFCNAGNCDPSDLQAEQALNQQKVSPVAGVLSYNFNPAWSLTNTATYDTQASNFQSETINFHYQPVPTSNRIINIGYQFERGADPLPSAAAMSSANNLSRVLLSFSEPVFHAWNALGAVQYNVSHESGQEYLVGLSYDTCCWAMQLLGTRQFSQFSPQNNPQYNNGVMVEFTLKGLGSIGNNTISQVTQFIPGYQGPASQ